MDLSSAQTVTGVKTFSTAPNMTQINNTGLLTLPSGAADTLVGRNTTDTLINKTLTLPIIVSLKTGAFTLTMPLVTDTLVSKTSTDILTNKTLTLPVISQIVNTGTLTLPTTTGILALTSQVVDLTTNQNIAGNKNFTSTTFTNLNNKVTSTSYTNTSTSASPVDIFTFFTGNNTAVIMESTVNFYCTAGTNINKGGSRRLTSRVTNVGGIGTLGNNLENLSSNDAGLNGVSISYLASLSGVTLTFFGLASQTFNITGVTTVFSM